MTKWHCSMLCSDMYEIEIQVRYEMSIDLVLSLAKYTTTLTLSILYLQLHLIFFNIQWSLTFAYYKQAFVQPFVIGLDKLYIIRQTVFKNTCKEKLFSNSTYYDKRLDKSVLLLLVVVHNQKAPT